MWGWGVAQFPYIVEPDLTFANTAAPDSVLRPLLIVLIIGAVFLVPSFLYLYHVFKGAQSGGIRSNGIRDARTG
jgi:cytochrome d ubiquinol oxidase subunit II